LASGIGNAAPHDCVISPAPDCDGFGQDATGRQSPGYTIIIGLHAAGDSRGIGKVGHPSKEKDFPGWKLN